MQVVLASANMGKIAEIEAVLGPMGLKVIPQSHFQVDDVEETGSTFIENAILKARHASKETGLPALADDSGLVVPALGGAPGIYSARYAGSPSNAGNNIQKLLNTLIAEKNRVAFFYSCLVLMQSPEDPAPLIAEGHWYGQILMQPVGQKGFGYDPIFFDAHLKCSAAELSIVQKNQVSHRGQALKKLIQQLKTINIENT